MKFLEKKPAFFVAMSALFFAILLIVFRDFAFDATKLMLNSDQLNGIGSRILRTFDVVLTEWDDSRLGGVPTIDALFADAYHPLVWVQFLMDPARAVGFKFILTLWVAFMSAFALGWHLTGNKWWGVLLGMLYSLSPEFFTYIYGGHDGKMMVFAIAPLSLLAIRKVVRSGSIPYMIVLALTVAWMILGSHLQLTYLFLWGAGLYTLYEIAFNCDGMKTRGKRIGLAAIGLAFGLSLSCFQILPSYLYTTTQSVRGDDSHTNYGHAVSWSLHQEEMAQILLPGFVGVDVYEQNEKTGDLEGSSFVNVTMDEYRSMASGGGSPFYWGHNYFKLDHNNAGALLTFLGFLCLFLPGKRRYAAFWGLGAVVALSYGMGDHSPLFKLWYNVLPGVKNFRAPGMALFWLPLLLVMMAGPVLKALTAESSSGEEASGTDLQIRTADDDRRALMHGTAMYGVLLVLAVVARFAWITFIGPVGLVVMIAYGVLCLGVMSVDDQKKKLNVVNLVDAFKAGLPGTHRALQACVFLGFAFLGVMLMSGQKLMENPITAPYFKPLNELVMTATAGKVIPGFVLILVIIAATWAVFKWKAGVAAKAAVLAAVAGVELFVINGAFVQNVAASEYLQPNNAVVAAVKAPFKADSLNQSRVLSLSRSKALSGNIFPQYHLRNADGIHDNELASYRLFRGGQQDANYLMNINEPAAAHPFLDLMNIGAVIFDSRQGTTYMPIPTAMGEAYIYGEAVVMDDETAVNTLKNEAAIRQEKTEETVAETVSDSATVDSSVAKVETPAPKYADEDGKFFYREKVILSEMPSADYKGSVAAKGPIQGSAKVIDSPKMDTQVFAVEADRPGFMVVAGNYHPYWKAYVNGTESKVLKAFGNLRAVEIPAGKSEVRMEYRSVPFHNSVKVSLAALVLLVALGAFAAVKGLKKA